MGNYYITLFLRPKMAVKYGKRCIHITLISMNSAPTHITCNIFHETESYFTKYLNEDRRPAGMYPTNSRKILMNCLCVFHELEV